mgnify:FL=1
MSHAKNKVIWCLNKAKKELKEEGKHRGLIQVEPNKVKALEHIKKAEHNLEGAINFHKIGFSDWSASAFFYSMYQSFLAIAIKSGYESGNQECTFALMHYLIEEKKIDIDKELIDKVATLDVQKEEEKSTSVEIREKYQYGTGLSIEENLYQELLLIAKKVLSKAKTIVE